MPKFSAASISDLFTAQRCVGRADRVAAYALLNKTFTHLVACEASDGSWCEFDGESLAHAQALANNAVDKLGARGCTVWSLGENGRVVGPPCYNVFETYGDNQ